MRKRRKVGKTCAGVLAAAMALTLSVVATPQVTAQNAPVGSPTLFNDPSRIMLASQPAPGGWLGFAPQFQSHAGFFVGQTNRSVAIDTYGFAGTRPSRIPEGDMLTLGGYGNFAIPGEIIDVAVGHTTSAGSPSVAVLHDRAGVAWISYFGPLESGMSLIESFALPDGSGTASTADAVGVIILGRQVVTATRGEIRFFDASSIGLAERNFDRRLDSRDSIIGITQDEGATITAASTFAIARKNNNLANSCAYINEMQLGTAISQPPISAVQQADGIGCVVGDIDRADLTYVHHGLGSSGGPLGVPLSSFDGAYVAALTVTPDFTAPSPTTSIMFADSGLAQGSLVPPLPTCENHVAAGAAVAPGPSPVGSGGPVPHPFVRAACLSEPDASGTATLTTLFLQRAGSTTSDESHSMPVETRLVTNFSAAPREIAVAFPCREIDRRQQTSDCDADPRIVSALVVSDVRDRNLGFTSTIMSHTVEQSVLSLSGSANNWAEYVERGLTLEEVDVEDLVLAVELDPEFAGCRTGSSGPCTPGLRQSAPIPQALLAAPPTLAGANQGGYAPVFAQSTTAGTTATTTESSSFAVTVDAAPSLFDIIEVGVNGTYGNQVDSSSSSSLTTTSANGYGGSMDDDVVVYTTTTNWVYTGTIVESSTGVGLGDATEILQPAQSVTTSASWTALQQQFPNEFSPDRGGLGEGSMYASIEAAFSNTVGAPATYLATPPGGSPDDAVNAYCVGDLNGTPPERPGGVTVDLNPFYFEQAELFPANQEAILTSEWHVVGAGSNAVETASFSIEAGSEYGYMQSRSLDVNTVGKLLGAGVEYAGGHTWGAGQSTQLSVGTQFIGGVGQFPHTSLSDETYFWRMVLCKRNVTDAGLPWVLTYQVRGYSGDGVEPLNPPNAEFPINSTYVSVTQPLQFLGSEIQADYTVEVEAVSAPDARRFTVSPPPVASGSSQVADIPGGPLLPGELYRWQVTATDVVGRTAIGSTGFFRTQGVPNPVVEIDGSTTSQIISVGDTVILTDDGDNGGSPVTTRTFRVNGATVGTGNSTTFTPQAAGVYLVEVRSTNAFGSSTAESTVFAAPVGRLDQYQLDEDASLIVDEANGVMANDSGGVSALLGTTSGRGTLTFDPDGSFDYTPEADQCGDFGFDYTLVDTISTVTPTPVQVAIACFNDAPTVLASSYNGVEDQPVVASSPGVLAGAVDPDMIANGATADDTVTAELIDQPAHGTVTVGADGAFTYSADPDYCGPDQFTFTAEDSAGARSVPGVITLDIACDPDAPVAQSQSVTTNEDTEVAGSLTATDAEQDTVTFALDTPPAAGVAVVQPDGSYSYKPDPDVCGPDSFRFVASDATLASPAAIVDIDVTCINDAPRPVADSATTAEEVAVDVDVTANDVDVDSTNLSVAIAAQSAHGVASVSTGLVVYTPDPDFTGTDTVTYTLTDDDGASATAQLTVTVTGVDDPPTAVTDVYGAVAGTTLTVDAPTGLLANDIDVDADGLTIVSNSDPTVGTVTVATDGSFVFDSTVIGVSTFAYEVSDNTTTATASVTIDVQAPLSFPVEPPPVTGVEAAPGEGGAIVTYSTPVVPGATVTCTPPSGSFFPIGDTEVTCTAMTGSPAALQRGATDTAVAAALLAGVGVVPQTTDIVFTVTVDDTEAPVFVEQPADIVVNDATGPRAVDFDVPVATDNDPRPMTVTCDPAPGSTFPVGATMVRCVATDASGLAAETMFTVTVLTMPDLGGRLPETGSPTRRLIVFAGSVSFVGIAILIAARRRRSIWVR